MTNTKKSAKLITAAFVVLCLCYMIPNYAQYQVSPLGPQVIQHYGIELHQLSSLFSAPMIPAVFFSLIAGLLIDKLGAKGIVGIGMILTSVGCVWRIFSGSFAPLFIATLLTGFSACFINAGSGKIIANLYGPEHVPAKMGLLMAASTGAMTIANLTTAFFPSITAAFAVSAAIACVCTLLWFVIFQKEKDSSNQETSADAGVFECIKIVVKCRDIWYTAFALFFLMAGNVVISSFLPTALASREVSSTTAGTMAAFYTVGNFLGCFTAPMMVDKMHSQKKVIFLFGVMAALGVAFAWHIPMTVVLAIALLLTGNFVGGMIPSLMGIPVQLPTIGPAYAGTAGGIIGTVQLLGAVLVPSFILAPIAGNSFNVLFILGGLCIFVSGALALFVKDIQ